MEYVIAFNFVIDGGTQGLNAQINITDQNTISFAGNKSIQILPYAAAATPPLVSFSVSPQSISVLAPTNSSGNEQSVQVVVPINAVGSSLSGNFPFSGVVVSASYQFIGYSARGTLEVGNFNIAFPTS